METRKGMSMIVKSASPFMDAIRRASVAGVIRSVPAPSCPPAGARMAQAEAPSSGTSVWGYIFALGILALVGTEVMGVTNILGLRTEASKTSLGKWND